MTIRTFTAGDDAAQVGVYNEAAADLPKFKAVTLDELRRRLRGPDFDPATHFFAVENGRPVGYATFHANGRISFPWCRKGRESWAGPLLDAVLEAMRRRGMRRGLRRLPGRLDGPARLLPCPRLPTDPRGREFHHGRGGNADAVGARPPPSIR